MKAIEQIWDFSSQSRSLMSIEYLVNNIARRYVHEQNLPPQARSLLSQEEVYASRVMLALSEIRDLYQPNYDYAEAIQVFWVGCREVGLLRDNGWWSVTPFTGQLEQIAYYRAVIALIDRLPLLVLGPEYARREIVRRNEARNKLAGLDQYLRAVLALRHKVHVVRVDGGYRTEAYPYVQADFHYESMERFREMIKRGRGAFEHCLGYVMSAEQGISREWHFHALLVFDASFVSSDWHRAKWIGEEWIKCANDFGSYFNCNALAARYELLGINGLGLVYRDDLEKQALVLQAARYLSDPDKDDQYLRMRPAGKRTFWRGVAQEHSGLGRPIGGSAQSAGWHV